VDNGSRKDGFASTLNRLDVRYYDAGGNQGFGQACNLGASIAHGKFLVFVNPDIIFINDSLELFSEGFRLAGEDSIVGLNMVDNNAEPSYAAGRFPSLSLELIELLYVHRWIPRFHAQLAIAHTYVDSDEIKEVDYVCGALFGISQETFRKLNGFNPKIFLYFEETELMYRHRETGRGVYLMCRVSAIHEGSVSTVENSDFKLHQMESGRHIFYVTRYRGVLVYIARIIRGLRLIMLYLSKRKMIYIRLLPTVFFGPK
jgi:GT2 family glycosyltransferase